MNDHHTLHLTPHAARRVMQRADELAACSEEPDRITRRFATPALRHAVDRVAGWMREAGMDVREDNVGNLIGRYAADREGARTLLLGSHLDSVRDAGRYDGPLGVLIALACVHRLHAQNKRLPFAIEIAAFADEEGLRFHTAYLGSTVVAGKFDPQWLALRDADGMALRNAIQSYGCDPDVISHDAYDPADLLGYCEVHIEQGPVLQDRDLPVGVVTAIAGQSRFAIALRGVAGHAGTVPMALRHDALAAAAEFIVAVEAAANAIDGLVATVGQIAVEPGASNVIPGLATLSLDVRHADDDVRQNAIRSLREIANALAERRRVAIEWNMVQESRSVPCDPKLTALLEGAIADRGFAIERLVSGAGHDGVMIANIAPIAMLFVRCRDGISHNPAESVTIDDVQIAIDVLSNFLERAAYELV
jgi:allantoate deiminase